MPFTINFALDGRSGRRAIALVEDLRRHAAVTVERTLPIHAQPGSTYFRRKLRD
jgi:hypothetical protein